MTTAKQFPTDVQDIGAPLEASDKFFLADASAGSATVIAALSRIWDLVNSTGYGTGFNRNTGITDTGIDLRCANGNHWMQLYANLTAGTTNPGVVSSDHALLFSDGTINTGALFIGPLSDTAAGLRIDSSGNVTHYGGTISGPSISATSLSATAGAVRAVNSGANANVVLRDETPFNQGLLFWNRSDDTARIGWYDGTPSITSNILLGSNYFNYGSNAIWRSDNLNYASGVWTPTATPLTNCGGITAANGLYLRMNAIIFAACEVTFSAIAGAGTATEFTLSPPVASNFGATYDCDGIISGVLESNGQVLANPTTDVIRCLFNVSGTASHNAYVFFSMKVL